MESTERFQDPKPFNTVSLITQRNEIKKLIDAGFSAKAFTEMCTLVCEFDLTEDEEDMLNLKRELINNKKAPFLPSTEDIDFYDKINMYMNRTYCRGFKAQMGEKFFEGLADADNGNSNSSEQT